MARIGPIAAVSAASAGDHDSPDADATPSPPDPLAASEQRLRDFLETAADRLWEMDAELRLSYVSPGRNGTMVEPALMLGKTRWELAGVDPDCDPVWRAHVADLKARRPFRDFEFRLPGPDGQERIHSSSGRPVFDAAGQFLGYRGTVRDVTERRRMERALWDSEQRFKLALEAAGAGLFDVDLASSQVTYNDRAATMLGYRPGELPIHLNDWVERLHPDDREMAIAKMHQHLAGETELLWSEQRQRTRTGAWRWFACVGKAIEHDADGQPRRLIGIRVDITERKQAQMTIEHLAFHDELTGLPNRRYFNNELERACATLRRQGTRLAVMLLDVDHFKDINDTLGHSVGDRLLIQVARRLRHCVGASDLIARIGGDEFAIIAIGRGEIESCGSLAERIIAALSRPIDIDDQTMRIGVSIGITICPDDGAEVERALANADLALYAAKNAGRHTWRLFDQHLHQKVRARHLLDQELRRALQLGQFELHYQPLVDVTSSAVQGFEALIRWQHAEHGCMAPNDFLGMVERSPVLGPLTEWTLRSALGQRQAWAEQGLGRFRIAVNVSAVSLKSQGLVDLVARCLAAAGTAPSDLVLEITEGSLCDASEAVPVLSALRGLGVTIALDDFGSGYSCLSRLRSLPIDTVKIDRASLANVPRDPDQTAIAELLIRVGHSLGKQVIAEGVETIDQLRYLEWLGCSQMQGFLVAAPLPAGAVPGWLEHWRRSLPAAQAERPPRPPASAFATGPIASTGPSVSGKHTIRQGQDSSPS
jgi:diguanylate cyclase (GGDEF)-like protein/PAS domain S-box-containing protein